MSDRILQGLGDCVSCYIPGCETELAFSSLDCMWGWSEAGNMPVHSSRCSFPKRARLIHS